jgi:hypothetical protein
MTLGLSEVNSCHADPFGEPAPGHIPGLPPPPGPRLALYELTVNRVGTIMSYPSAIKPQKYNLAGGHFNNGSIQQRLTWAKSIATKAL